VKKHTADIRLGTVLEKEVERFQAHCAVAGLTNSLRPAIIGTWRRKLIRALAALLRLNAWKDHDRENRIDCRCSLMEGWDGYAEENRASHTFERWKKFGRLGAKTELGGEARLQSDARGF